MCKKKRAINKIKYGAVDEDSSSHKCWNICPTLKGFTGKINIYTWKGSLAIMSNHFR